MEIMKTWILTMTGAALAVAIAEGLCPAGAVKRVVRLTGGLFLLAVLLQMVGEFDPSAVWKRRDAYQAEAAETIEDFKTQEDQKMKALIEKKTAAYIVDKAAELGAACDAEVNCETGDSGVPVPVEVWIGGEISPEQQRSLTEILEKELGIDRESQYYEGGSGN